jgi:ribosomal protein S18 acetylase RimI-like enzyme
VPHANPSIRRATRGDENAIVRVLARAFREDPVARYLLRKNDYPGALEIMFGTFLRHMTMPHGEVYLEAKGGGAALWTPPGKWDVKLGTTLAMGPSLLRAAGIARAARSGRAMMRMQALHPREPHYYLFAIGVDPDRQGHGIGSALLHTVLRTCDQTKTAAYLEASTEGSSRLYARHGFSVTSELRMTPDCPPVWLMWRNPQPESLGAQRRDSSRGGLGAEPPL